MNIKDDIEVLARTIFGEARGESREGKIAVANVVMNRVRKRCQAGFVRVRGQKLVNIAATCLKPYQFSCWLKNDPNLEVIRNIGTENAVYRECLLIAKDAAEGNLNDITMGATHYYNPRGCKCPAFARGKQPCLSLGAHLFFNDID